MGTPKIYDEGAVLLRLKAGDADAYMQVYNQYAAPIYIYILRFVKIPSVAEDVLQDVFMKIWEVRERIDPEGSFQAYLYRISRNSVFKLMKKVAADEVLRLRIMQQLQQNTQDAELQVLWKQYEELLNEAINQLPPQRQKVFRLCREEGKTYEEAAAELGISRNTVKEHMVYSMKSIKDYFSRHQDIPLAFLLALFFKP